MAKIDSSRLPSKKTFTVSIYDNQHRKNLALRAKKVTDLYDSVVASLTQQAALHFEGTKPNEEFDWKDYPQLQKLADKLIDNLGTSLQANIDEGCQEAWTLADTKNDAMVDYLTQNYNLKQSVIDNLKRPHTEALAEYLKRRDEGMGLSDGTGNLKGVWNLGEFKSELELSLEACIGRGMSAADMSREIRQYLKYPDKLFRRVRDKDTGALRLSKAAAAFHPGRGVYRSSYKNALRLTATENNIAYRSADHARWQNLDFVVGIEICISNNHPVNDICDELCGKYPKEFKFTGWHPWCRCFAVPVLASDEQCERYFKAIENGEDVTDWNFNDKVTEMPDVWNKWISDNKERITNASSLPYFIKDNFKNGDINKGLRWATAKKTAIKKVKEPAIGDTTPTFKERLKNGETIEELVKRLGKDTPITLRNYAKQIENNVEAEYDRSMIKPYQEKSIKDALQATLEKSDFGMLIQHKTLEKILDSKFMNQLETGTSGGVLNKAARKEYSAKAFGTPKTAKAEEFEKYGLLLDKDKLRSLDTTQELSNYTSYGTIEVRLNKDKVIATFTAGDSLDNYSDIMPSLTTDPKSISVNFGKFESVSKAFWKIAQANPRAKGNKLSDMVKALNAEYIELQYHGTLTAKQIESVTFPSFLDVRFAKDGVKKAMANGIDVFYKENDKIVKLTKQKAKTL